MANGAFPGFLASSAAIGGGKVSYVRRRVLTNNTNEIACQDSVKATNAGDWLGLGTSSTHATGVDGASAGASYIDSSGARVGRPNLPAATLYTSTGVDPINASYIFVTEGADHIKFRCSMDTATALTNLLNNFDINLASSKNGYSQQELRFASAGVTATLPWHVTEYILAADNTLDSATHTHCLAMTNTNFTQPSLNEGGAITGGTGT